MMMIGTEGGFADGQEAMVVWGRSIKVLLDILSEWSAARPRQSAYTAVVATWKAESLQRHCKEKQSPSFIAPIRTVTKPHTIERHQNDTTVSNI
jgi:hypothetical protein